MDRINVYDKQQIDEAIREGIAEIVEVEGVEMLALTDKGRLEIEREEQEAFDEFGRMMRQLEAFGLVRIKAGSDPANPIWEKTELGLAADAMLRSERKSSRKRGGRRA